MPPRQTKTLQSLPYLIILTRIIKSQSKKLLECMNVPRVERLDFAGAQKLKRVAIIVRPGNPSRTRDKRFITHGKSHSKLIRRDEEE